MKNILILIMLLVALTGCETLNGSKSDSVDIELAGTPGLEFWGSCTVDGQVRIVSGTVPMTFETSGDKFDCLFVKRGVGDLKLILRTDGKALSEATSTTRAGGVAGRIDTSDVHVRSVANGF